MQVEIRWVDCPLDKALDRQIERRLRFALGRFEADVERATVRVRDLNHAHNGNSDKLCRIQLDLDFGPALVVEADAPDLLGAVDVAADRSARVVANTLKRRHYGRTARVLA